MFDISENQLDEFHKQFITFLGCNRAIEIEWIWEWFKSKKNACLDYQSFNELFCAFFIGDTSAYDDDIRLCFDYFDKNKDGQINLEEFHQVCSELLEPFLKPRAAFIIVDVQNDFISGSLAMKTFSAQENGEEIVPIINSILVKHLNHEFHLESIVYSYDWHPDDHISFFDNVHCRRISHHSPISLSDVKILDKVIIETDSGEETDQILWPKHCVQNTEGAALHKDLMIVDGAYHLKKGIFPNVDSYSAFGLNHPKAVTGLQDHLTICNINLLFICGLATDVCVAQTSFDAIKLGYRVALVKDASRGVDQSNIETIQRLLMEKHGIVINSEMMPHIIHGKIRPVQWAIFLIRNFLRDP